MTDSLRVAIIHSFYDERTPSGENSVVLDQVDRLRQLGHEVLLIDSHSSELRQEHGYKVRKGFGVAFGRGRNPSEELRNFKPDITHVHNLFPNFGSKWLSEWDGPIVATIHNYRAFCSNGMLFREGRPCTLCLDGHVFRSVALGCYTSHIQTLPLAIKNRVGVANEPLLRRADAIVMLSRRMRNLYEQAGMSELIAKVEVVPNFVNPVGAASPPAHGRPWVFVGRLAAEKGIQELLGIWPETEMLRVYGSGPLAPSLIHNYGHRSDLSFEGQRNRDSVRAALLHARGLIFPGLAPEGIPTVVLEALSAGIPIIANAGSVGSDIVEEYGVGEVFQLTSSSLLAALARVNSKIEALSAASRRTFNEHFSPYVWESSINSLYTRLISSASA